MGATVQDVKSAIVNVQTIRSSAGGDAMLGAATGGILLGPVGMAGGALLGALAAERTITASTKIRCMCAVRVGDGADVVFNFGSTSSGSECSFLKPGDRINVIRHTTIGKLSLANDIIKINYSWSGSIWHYGVVLTLDK